MNRWFWLLLAMLLGLFHMARPVHGVVVSDRNILTPGWWNTPMYYGATGDSTVDAKATIRSAYNRINDTTGGVIFFPPGVYRLSDSLIFWLDTVPNLTLQGSGYNTRIILEGTGGFHIKAATAGAGTGRFIIRDMSIWSATNQKHQYALNLENIGTFTISNVQIQGRDSLSKGVLFKGTQQGLFSSGYINQCDTAVFLDSSQGVSANSINIHSVNMTGRSGVPKGIGVLTRRVQTGVIDGYGQITNFAYGVYQIGAEGYNILNTMFETDSTAIYVASGEHTIIIGNAFYTTTKNDIYLAGGSRAQIASNLFNGKVTVGANATQPRFVGNLFSNLYTDSVTSTLNRPEFAWNHNQGSGTGPSGLKFSTATDDSLDLRIRSLGAIDARLNADSACFLRLSGAGTSSDDKWKSTTSSYRKGRMGIEFGDSVNSATAPLYAIFGSTNSANGLYVATYAGVTIDSLLPRLRISGSAATADVLFSNITNVYKAVVTADSQYVTKRYVDDSAGTGTGTDTSLALGDATTSPGDTVDWRGDSVAVNSSNDTTWIKSNDALIIDAAQVGEGSGAVIVGSDTLRADDSGLTYLGLANRPWGLFYQTQLYLLETTGTDSWIPVSRVAPSTGQPLEFDGTSWAPGTDGGSGGVTSADTSGDGTLDVTIPDSIGLYQGTGMDLAYNATGRKLTFNSSGGSDNDTGKVLSDLGTGAIDRKIEWSSQQIRIEDLTASAQVVQIIAPNDILVVGDTTGGVLRVLAQLQLFTDSATSGDVRMMLPFDTTDVAGPTNGQGFIWSSANGQFELTTLSASGTGDTLLVQIAGVDYTIINNTIKAKEAYGVDFVRHDSTGYDVWLISVDTAALPFDLYLPIAGNIPMPYPTYRFDDATADADPGNGDIRFNSATPASVTILYVDDVTIIGEGADALWNVVDTGYIVSVQQKADLAADASQYRVTGKTDAAGYWKINVTVLGSGTLPAASDTLHLTVTARDVRTGGSTDSLYVLYEADVAGETSEWHFSGDTVHVDTADATGGGGDDTVTVLGDVTSNPDDIAEWDTDSLLLRDVTSNAQQLYFGSTTDKLHIRGDSGLVVGDTTDPNALFRVTARLTLKVDTGTSNYMDMPFYNDAVTGEPADNEVWAWSATNNRWEIEAQTGGAGESNTISAIGETASGADSLAAGKSGVDLRVKSIIDGDFLTSTVTDTTVEWDVDTTGLVVSNAKNSDTAVYLTGDPGGAEWVGYNPTGNYFTPHATHDVDIGSRSFQFSSSYIDSGFFGNRLASTETPNDRNVIFASDSIDAAGSQQTNGIMVAMAQTGQSSAIQSGIVGIMRPKPTVNDTVDESRGVRGILLKDGQGDLLKGIAVLGEFRTDAGDSNSGSHIVEAWGVSGQASLRDSSDAEQLFSLYGERPYVVAGHGAQADLAIGVGGQQPKDSGITNGFALFLERAGTGALSGQWPIKMAFRDTAGAFHTIQYDHRDARVEFSDPIHVTGAGEVTARMTVGDALVVDSLESVNGSDPIAMMTNLNAASNDITGVDRLEIDSLKFTTETAFIGFDSSFSVVNDSLHAALCPDGYVTGPAKIATDAVGAEEVAANAIDADEVADGTLDEPELFITNAPADNDVLTANTAATPDNFTWETPVAEGALTRLTGILGMTGWKYDGTSTTDGDPGAGVMRFNDAVTSGATFAYLDDATFTGQSVDTLLKRVHAGDLLWAGQAGVPADQAMYRIGDASTDGTGYWKIPITYIDGISDFTNQDTLIFNVIFARDSAGGGGSGDDTVAILDADGGSAAERPYIDILNGGGLADTAAFLTDSTQALIWTDSVLAMRGKQGTVLGDTGSANPLRTVINNTRAMYQTEDSTRIDSAFTANRISTDSVQLGEGWIAQADGAGLVITSGVLDVVGDSTITVAAGSMTVANIPDVSVDSNKAVNGSLSSSDIHAMVSDSLARILSDENGTAGGFVRSTVASDLTLDGVDIQGPVDSLGADTVVVNSYFSPPSEYVYLTDVHGFGRALSDEIYLQTNLETPNGDTTYLVRDSAGNITAGDQDTVNISGVVPWNCTVESLTVFYVVSTGSEIVDNWLRGPDKSTFTNLTDSIYLANTTDLTSTSWATQHYTASNFAALGGYRFSWKYIVQLDTDNDRLRIGWVRLKVRRAG